MRVSEHAADINDAGVRVAVLLLLDILDGKADTDA